MIKVVGIICNFQKEIALESSIKCKEWLEKHECNVYIYNPDNLLQSQDIESTDKINPKTNVCIVFGGDGTFLYAARHVSNFEIPMLCVNVGHLGFLSELDIKELFNGLEILMSNKYSIQDRLMLDCYVYRDHQFLVKLKALNECVIAKSSLARLISLKTYVDQNYITTYNADGLIISTPTGSTAYSLNAGGPIVAPDVESIIIAPICPITISARPLVISAKHTIRTTLSLRKSPKSQEVLLTMDGQDSFPLKENDEIIIRRSPYYARFIKLFKDDFFYVLRTKLQWG